MDTNEMLDETIGRWLQDTAPARLPERVLDTTFERTRRTRQHVGLRAFLRKLRIPRFAPALGGAAVVVAATAVWLGMYADQTGIGGPVTFVGTWESHADADGGHQTMEIAELADGTYDVTIRDDVATVCGLTPSTMTGVAEAHEPGTIVIAQPVYVCDDGSDAETLSGPPLEAVLQDLGFTYDAERDAFQDSLGLVWSRVEATP